MKTQFSANKKRTDFHRFFIATGKGLEPLLTESESAVLPITPFRIVSFQRTYIIITSFRQKSTPFFYFFNLLSYRDEKANLKPFM